ncbi:MAG: alpha/beta fold hydrolase [Polyangiales bacterium]
MAEVATETPTVVGAAAAEPVRTPQRALAAWRLGLVAAAPSIAAATVVLHAVPHMRGLGFPLALRLAVLAPACVIAGVAAAQLFRARGDGWRRPRLQLALLLLTAAAVGGVGITWLEGAEPALLAAPALAVVAALLAWLVPRWHWRPLGVWGRAAWTTLAVLELTGAATGWLTERADDPAALRESWPGVEHHFVSLPGGARVHYVDEGRGPTLLFLHGNPAWSYQWRDLIAALSGSHRCIALDYPGFGLSAAGSDQRYDPGAQSRVLEAFVAQLGLGPVTLVMQDWGGPIGLGFAGRHPELVTRVVIGSTWAWPTDPSSPRGMFSRIVGGGLGELAQVNWNGFARMGVQHGIVHESSDDVVDAYVRPFATLSRRGIAAYYPGQITGAAAYFAEVERGLARVRDKPALIFWAGKDEGFPRDELTRFQHTFPQHEVIELPDASHFFFEDERVRVADAIGRFAR